MPLPWMIFCHVERIPVNTYAQEASNTAILPPIINIEKMIDLFWTSTFPTPLCIPVTQMLVPMQHLIQDILPGEPRGFWVVMLVKVLNWGKHFEWARCSHFIDYCVHRFTFFFYQKPSSYEALNKNCVHLFQRLWYIVSSSLMQRPLNHLKSSTF